jgi:hypothetical protein
MWRLLLSGLFCLPALVILFDQRTTDSDPSAHANRGTPAGVVTSHASAPTMHLSLPVELLIEPALPDPDLRNVTGPSVAIPLQDVMTQMSTIAPPVGLTSPRSTADVTIAMRPHRSISRSGHHDTGGQIASRAERRPETPGTLIAFIARNLTRRAFALPAQNGGG